MKFGQTDTPMQAAAKAGFGQARGHRIQPSHHDAFPDKIASFAPGDRAL
jgi:hypothetical protein